MKLYDISQEVFSCAVFPGDPAPERISLMKMGEGAVCNLTALKMCAHNGTHVHAPCHFIAGGKSIDRIPLDRFVGWCCVFFHEGDITAEDAESLIKKARLISRNDQAGASRRILVRGGATVTPEAARVFARHGILLFGNESQAVGPENAPMDVHRVMLDAEIVLLEGIRLSAVPDGIYLLCAAPLNLSGSDGSPCRAVLIDL